MPTIKDIAREAGVAQGTVSNVLNGKGNVSSDKILLVEQACKKLGYTINQRAKTLRQGQSTLLAVVLPNLHDRRYTDFFLSFKHYAESQNYSVRLYLSNDLAQNEEAQLPAIRSEMTAGVATFSCCADGSRNIYAEAGLPAGDVVFVERTPFGSAFSIGFDYRQAGAEMAEKIQAEKAGRVLLITESLNYSGEKAFYDAFMSRLKGGSTQVHHIQTDPQHCYTHFLQTLNELEEVDIVVLTGSYLAEIFSNVSQTFYSQLHPAIYSLSPLYTIPTVGFKKYELNYRLMGKTAAEQLIERKQHHLEEVAPLTLPNDGFRSWISKIPGSKCKRLTLLTFNSPTARIVENMARIYTDATGIEVNVATSSYDGIYETLSGLGNMEDYDVIRLDYRWLSWFGEQIFTPLQELTPNVEQLFEPFIPGLVPEYTNVNGVSYVLPETPSPQLLFYRKDLFENVALQRLYKETYKEELTPPKDFASFNRIARFFTKKYNSHSPTAYGTSLTMGNSSTAAIEYLTRYFSHTHDLFDAEGNLLLDTPIGVQAMNELIEAKEYSPRRYNNWWRETAREFSLGNTAMTILFSNYASEMMGSHSAVTNEIGYAVLPGGNTLLSGGSIGVCKASKNKREAFDFIKWICSEEITTAMTLLGSVSPCEKTYSNYEVLDTYPWLSLSRKCFSQSLVNRLPPQKKQRFNERRFFSIIAMAVNNTYNGTTSAQEALAFAVKTYNRAMREESL